MYQIKVNQIKIDDSLMLLCINEKYDMRIVKSR